MTLAYSRRRCSDDRVTHVICQKRLAARTPSHGGLRALACGALFALSCGPAQPATEPSELRALPPPLRVIPQHEPLRGYRLAESFVAQGPIVDGAPLRVGTIVKGLRVR